MELNMSNLNQILLDVSRINHTFTRIASTFIRAIATDFDQPHIRFWSRDTRRVHLQGRGSITRTLMERRAEIDGHLRADRRRSDAPGGTFFHWVAYNIPQAKRRFRPECPKVRKFRAVR